MQDFSDYGTYELNIGDDVPDGDSHDLLVTFSEPATHRRDRPQWHVYGRPGHYDDRGRGVPNNGKRSYITRQKESRLTAKGVPIDGKRSPIATPREESPFP